MMEKISEKLNNIIMCLIIIIVLLTLNTIINVNKNLNNPVDRNENQSTNESYDVSAFTEIKPKDIITKTKDKKLLIYVGRESCGWCVKFVPNLTNATKIYKLETLHIDLAKIINFNSGAITDKENYDFLLDLSATEKFKDFMKDNLGTTPMLIIVENGIIVGGQTGYMELEQLNSYIEENEIK